MPVPRYPAASLEKHRSTVARATVVPLVEKRARAHSPAPVPSLLHAGEPLASGWEAILGAVRTDPEPRGAT